MLNQTLNEKLMRLASFTIKILASSFTIKEIGDNFYPT